MNYILIIGIFEALFLVLLLISKKQKSKPDLFLGIILGLYALSIFLTYIELYNIQNGFPFPKVINLNWLILLLHGPALWVYIKSLSSDKLIFKPIYLLHLVPFITFMLIHYITFISLPADEKITIAKSEIFKEEVFYKISILCIGLSTITYNIWALYLIHNYRIKLRQYYSNTKSLDLRWLSTLTIASLSIYLLNTAIFNLDLVFKITSYKILMLTTYSFASIYVLVIGFFGMKQKNIFIVSYDTFSSKRNKTKFPKEDKLDFIETLRVHMDEERLFLDPEINLLKLSEKLEVKTEYLSEILNSRMHQSFFEFINRYRIDEFKKQCINNENKHLSIIGIAYNCGFNSKASFYRAFKKYERMSPTLYIKKVSK